MISGKKIIIVSSIDWDFNWQGHQEITSTLARHGNQVLFIENTGIRVPRWNDTPRLWKRLKRWSGGVRGIRQVAENLYVFSPVVIPFPYSRLASWINRRLLTFALGRWMKWMHFHRPILWIFLPTRISLDLIEMTDPELVAYYCIADFATLVDSPKKIEKYERRLLEQADIVFVQGEELRKKCLRVKSEVHIFPFGADVNLFQFKKESSAPPELKSLSRPILGYVGGIHRHVDFPLIASLAKRRPEWTWVFVGQVQTEPGALKEFPNVKLLGPRPHEELPRYVRQFDVCLVPYLLNDYTRTVYPTKINEYLLMGKPVVSTALPEVIALKREYPSLFRIGATEETFEKCVLQALGDLDPKEVEKRVAFGRQNGWEARLEKMNALIEAKIKEKYALETIHWSNALKRIYRRTKQYLMTLALLLGLAWAVLLYSPFLWGLASPLQLRDAPQKADAIVVLGGGVGETGSPGKSTMERARYAAELYKEGWAPAIIFSSGYVYSYQEVEDMKLIAMSSDIPKEAIFLETRSSNTYQNVRFVKGILDQKGWRSILLVSAPYHMRRVSLVFRKIAPETQVFYLPVQKCSFYGIRRPVQMNQIQALFHEVVGILYYWWKGYV